MDLVTRLHQHRKADFRRGTKLGKDDHLVIWEEPKQRPAWLDPETYAGLPDHLVIRELRAKVTIAGFGVKDLRSLKTVMQMVSNH